MDEIASLPAILIDLGGPAALESRTEDRGDAGVRRITWHSRPVDIVVTQRDSRPAGHPRPGGGQVLLCHLAGGIGVTGIQRCRLDHRGGRELLATARAAWLELACRQVVGAARGR